MSKSISLNIPTFSKCLVAPKMLFWERNNKKLKIEEYLSNSFKKSSDYVENGIVLKYLSEKQILDCVKEMEMVIDNEFDLDLYRPTKDALREILPRMAKGGIIMFDELNHSAYPGETKAFLEILNNEIKFKLTRSPYSGSKSYVEIE